MSQTSNRITIFIAILGLIGTLGAALLANWDKVFPQTSGRNQPEMSSAVPTKETSMSQPQTVKQEAQSLRINGVGSNSLSAIKQ